MEDECLKPDNFHADPGPAFSPAEHSLRSGVVMNWPPREYRMARAFIRNIIGPAIGAAAVGAGIALVGRMCTREKYEKTQRSSGDGAAVRENDGPVRPAGPDRMRTETTRTREREDEDAKRI